MVVWPIEVESVVCAAALFFFRMFSRLWRLLLDTMFVRRPLVSSIAFPVLIEALILIFYRYATLITTVYGSSPHTQWLAFFPVFRQILVPSSIDLCVALRFVSFFRKPLVSGESVNRTNNRMTTHYKLLDYLRANRLDSYPIQERSIILPRLSQSIRLNTPQNGLKSSFDCRHFSHLQTHLTHCFPLCAGRMNGERRRGASRGTVVVLSISLNLYQFSVLSTRTVCICFLLLHSSHPPISFSSTSILPFLPSIGLFSICITHFHSNRRFFVLLSFGNEISTFPRFYVLIPLFSSYPSTDLE